MSVSADEDFDEFVSVVWQRLCHAGWLLTGNTHDAEDLAQTALAKTYAAWRRVRRDSAFQYARRALVNASIDGHRRRRVVEVYDASAPEQAVLDDSAVRMSDREQLKTLLARLTPRERAIVVLRHYLDLSEEEVAGELGVSRGTVKSTASRALAKLRVVQDREAAQEGTTA